MLFSINNNYSQTVYMRLSYTFFFHLCNDSDGFPGAEEEEEEEEAAAAAGPPGMTLIALATCCVELTPLVPHVETPPSPAPPTGEPKVVGITV
jgi:hypothetical protein